MSDNPQPEEGIFLNLSKRKMIIQAALMRLKQKNIGFLEGLESHAKWRKIYNGLLFHNVQSQLNKLVSLQLCEATQNEEVAYFNPFEKIPISMCYNKIRDRQIFEKQAIYNLVLLYDSRTKKSMNWNKLQQTAVSTVRALNISNICKKNDKECFQSEIQKRVLNKERFKGKQLNFNIVYQAGIEDMTPISQISF